MNRRVALMGLFALAICLLASCGGGGGGNPVQPGTFVVVSAPDGTVGVHGGPGSVDAGSTVSLAAPASGTGVARANGSIDLLGDSGGAAAVNVEHVRGGSPLSTEVTVETLSSRVTAPLFTTAAGPNDLKLGNNSLYVACALDNKVQRFGLDGSLSSEAIFPQSSSPSFVALSENGARLYVVRNGDNFCTAIDAFNMTAFQPPLERSYGEVVEGFIGPGQSIVVGERVVSAVSLISSFGPPTVYEGGNVDVLDFADGGFASSPDTSGENGQSVALSPDGGLIYHVCAGSIQFDNDFHPFVTSSSTLDVFPSSINDDSDTSLQHLDLGEIGASAMAISPDGKTAYLGNQLNGNLYKVDLETLSVERGADNPIVLSSSDFTYISDVAFTPDGKLLLATSFNDDELYVLDTSTDTVNPAPYPGPIDVSLDPDLLAGTLGVETDGNTAWVIYAVGNAVGAVDLF